MWSRTDLKNNAKQRLSRHHWYAVLVLIIAGLLGAASSPISISLTGRLQNEDLMVYLDTSYTQILLCKLEIAMPLLTVLATGFSLFAILFSALISSPVSIGTKRYFLSAREVKTPVSEMFSAFRTNYVNAVVVSFMQNLFIFLWSLLLIIPGIIKAFSYFLVPYLLAENPDMDYRRALQLSSIMMNGHKFELFVLELSFIGWFILSSLTVGILGTVYVNPYLQSTITEFYVAVRSEAFLKGVASSEELPMVFS